VIASPYAKKLAREADVDISQATATGPEGRIVAADVQKLISEGGGKAKPQKADAPGPEQSGQVTRIPVSPRGCILAWTSSVKLQEFVEKLSTVYAWPAVSVCNERKEKTKRKQESK